MTNKELFKIGRQTGFARTIPIIEKAMRNKPPVHINQVLNLTVDRFGKEGDPVFVYKNFIIFLKNRGRLGISLNEFMKIRITKILPKFAIAELVE